MLGYNQHTDSSEYEPHEHNVRYEPRKDPVQCLEQCNFIRPGLETDPNPYTVIRDEHPMLVKRKGWQRKHFRRSKDALGQSENHDPRS